MMDASTDNSPKNYSQNTYDLTDTTKCFPIRPPVTPRLKPLEKMVSPNVGFTLPMGSLELSSRDQTAARLALRPNSTESMNED